MSRAGTELDGTGRNSAVAETRRELSDRPRLLQDAPGQAPSPLRPAPARPVSTTPHPGTPRPGTPRPHYAPPRNAPPRHAPPHYATPRHAQSPRGPPGSPNPSG